MLITLTQALALISAGGKMLDLIQMVTKDPDEAVEIDLADCNIDAGIDETISKLRAARQGQGGG